MSRRACSRPEATFPHPAAGGLPARHFSLVLARTAGAVVVARPARRALSRRSFAAPAASVRLCATAALRSTFDRDFAAVIDACAARRAHCAGTWITPEMLSAYCELHRRGHAHSIEVLLGRRLVGGFYGVLVGGVFFGESMFSRERDASKVALARLAETCGCGGIQLIDCQMASHLICALWAASDAPSRIQRVVAADRRPNVAAVLGVPANLLRQALLCRIRGLLGCHG